MQSYAIKANGNLDIGGTSNAGYVVVDISGTFSLNVTPQVRVAGTAAGVSENGFDTWYMTAGTYAKVASGTAVSAAGRIIIPAGGMTVSLLFESFASGTANIVVQQVEGPLPAWTA